MQQPNEMNGVTDHDSALQAGLYYYCWCCLVIVKTQASHWSAIGDQLSNGIYSAPPVQLHHDGSSVEPLGYFRSNNEGEAGGEAFRDTSMVCWEVGGR